MTLFLGKLEEERLTFLSNVVAYPCRHSREDRHLAQQLLSPTSPLSDSSSPDSAAANSRGSDSSLSDSDLLEILRKEENAASNYQWSALSRTREEALNYYDREPYGDEQDGASQVVTSEFADVIESIMPGLMRVFTGTDDVAEFTPSAPGEEKWAREASEYVPHVLMRQNDGFRILYWLIKDALMYRLGGVTVDLEDFTEKRRVPVQGLAAGRDRPDRGRGGEGRRRAGDGAGAGPRTQYSGSTSRDAAIGSPGYHSAARRRPSPARSRSPTSASAWWSTTSRRRTSCSRRRRATRTRRRSWASSSGSPRPTWSRSA